MRLYALTMTGDTNTAPSALKGLGRATSQADAIEKAINDGWLALTAHMQRLPVPFWQAVFLAPEYYFSNRRHQNDRFFSKDVKQYIVSRLAAVAKKYPRLLIVPGTVLWKKAAYEEEKVVGRRGKTRRVPSPKNAQRVNKALNRIENANKLFGTHKNLPGWSHAGKFGRDDSDTDNENKYDMPRYYLEKAKDLDTQIAQNVAYLFKDNVVLKYQKAGNYMEVNEESSNIVFAPGNISGVFKMGNVTYGIEICRDHGQKVLAKSGQKVNVQLLISSWIPNLDGHTMLSDGGVLLHASTKTTEKDTNVDPIHFQDSSTKLIGANRVGDAQLWILDLDDARCGITRSTDNSLKPVTLSQVSHVYPLS